MTSTYRVVITCPHCQREYPIRLEGSRLAELKSKATCSRCGKSFPTAGQILVEDVDQSSDVFEEVTPSRSLEGRQRGEGPTAGPPPIPSSSSETVAASSNRSEKEPEEAAPASHGSITASGLTALIDALAGATEALEGDVARPPGAGPSAAEPPLEGEAQLGWEPAPSSSSPSLQAEPAADDTSRPTNDGLRPLEAAGEVATRGANDLGLPGEALELAAALLAGLPLCSSHVELQPLDGARAPSASVATLEWLLEGTPDEPGAKGR